MKRTKTATSTPSSLSVVDSSTRAVTAEGDCRNDIDNRSGLPPGTAPNSLDFVGNSDAVKGLFSLPYATDRPISVAVHNIGGTLLLDSDPEQEVTAARVDTCTNHEPPATPEALQPEDDKNGKPTASNENLSQSLVALSNIEPTSEALSLVNSIIDLSHHRHSSNGGEELSAKNVSLSEKTHTSVELGIPQPDDYVNQFIPPVPEPREYFNWKFHNMNLLVGSNALIYRAPDASTSLAVRLEEAEEMRTLSRRHQEMVQSGEFVADHRLAKLQQMGKPSYAETTRRNVVQQIEEGKKTEDSSQNVPTESRSSSFAVPDLDQVRLQTCIVPAPNTPVGALFTARRDGGVVRLQPGLAESRSVSPVSAVLDTYLDNIMTNVPQLALCLQEKGFVQSVKLLNTDQIPSSLLDPSTIDTSVPFEAIKGGKPSDRVFSPEIMEMNAGTLLRFLKSQCTKDSATYLLRREAGQTDIQLYDISAQSSQSQQKWKWWLATMSYRFACRLRSLESATADKVLRRDFRARQRNLLLNTLDLLDNLTDMNGISHESLISAINENLADSFLTNEDDDVRPPTERASKLSPATFVASRQPYPNTSVDALGKAQDYLVEAIRVLWSTLERRVKQARRKKKKCKKRLPSSRVVVVSVHSEEDSSSESDEESDNEEPMHSPAIDPVAIQLFGAHHKLVRVSLRLAEIHLGNYYSSSAMQALRVAARRLADSAYLVQLVAADDREKYWIRQLQLQYTWLWEHCGHFARSFAADELWRDRGHASGEDVISVLRDVDTALRSHNELASDKERFSFFTDPVDSLAEKSDGSIAFNSLNGIVGSNAHAKKAFLDSSLESAGKILSNQGILKREQRRVLVAACLAYGRAIDTFKGIVAFADEEDPSQTTLLNLLQQRLGDACNETGKAMMDEVRNLIPTLSAEARTDDDTGLAADPLLYSAEFWFTEGLEAFEACMDVRNLALLRCNLCQCSKLRANSVFTRYDEAISSSEGPSHAEICLQGAAHHLQAAHEALDQRDTDPMTWDMVSGELAATLLVLGVRRRQSLIGSGNMPVILHSLRLSPGKERSIVDPMERALNTYEQLGNSHQAAATHYQLALFFSKIWTCQRDEVKTREKLASAFQHFTAAHDFFSRNVRGNEPTFCVLCLDLSNLYSSVSGEEFLTKALICCLDTSKAFAHELVQAAATAPASEWLDRMSTLSVEVEERVFKILRNLVKLEDSNRSKHHKELYRAGLRAKMQPALGDEIADSRVKRLLQVHTILETIRQQLEYF